MAFKMRQSKFRHVFGTPHKKDQCYDNIRISKSSLDSTFCSVNPKYVAIITEAAGGGAFLVLAVSKTGRVERDHPLVSGHKAAVLDIKWCPHNDDVIASASEDCTIMIWQIPEDGVLVPLTEPVATLEAHIRRVHLIEWHPTAQNLLLSAGADNKLFLWNVGIEEALVEYEMPDLCLSMSFNYDGTKFVSTCKDKMLRVYDTREANILAEGKGHDGSKPAQCVYLKGEKIFTTGFSRMSERQYALWNATDLSHEIGVKETIDNSNGVIFPFYDPDTNMVWLCGKGDSIIRFYEVTDEEPYVHYLNLFQSNQPQRGIGMMPKRGLNVNACEITRFYKLLNNGLCEVIPFTVPRKSELFQDDLYPDTAGDIPALTADEFMEGTKDSNPVLISLKSGYVPTKKEKMSAARKSNVLDTPNKAVPRKAAARTAAPATSNGAADAQPAQHTGLGAPAQTPVVQQAPAQPAAPAGPALPANFDAEKILKDIAALKKVSEQQNQRIVELEARLGKLESNTAKPTNQDIKAEEMDETDGKAEPEAENEEAAEPMEDGDN